MGSFSCIFQNEMIRGGITRQIAGNRHGVPLQRAAIVNLR
jgi:hypothetical protein